MKRLGLLFICFCFLSHLFSLLVPISVPISDPDFSSGFWFRISDPDFCSRSRIRILVPDFCFNFRSRFRIRIFGSGFQFQIYDFRFRIFSSSFPISNLISNAISNAISNLILNAISNPILNPISNPSVASASDNLISLSYSMPVFSANLFGLFSERGE